MPKEMQVAWQAKVESQRAERGGSQGERQHLRLGLSMYWVVGGLKVVCKTAQVTLFQWPGSRGQTPGKLVMVSEAACRVWAVHSTIVNSPHT